jgi:hypothetical protein
VIFITHDKVRGRLLGGVGQIEDSSLTPTRNTWGSGDWKEGEKTPGERLCPELVMGDGSLKM